jgi:RTX calcium-binding nonapeptide repeat (4 copies)
MARRALLAAAGAAGALLAVPAPAPADTQITTAGGVLYARNDDAGVANGMTVDSDAQRRVHFVDEGDRLGMTFPATRCSPGRVNSAGNPVEVWCDRSGVDRVSILIGPAEDRVTYAIDDLPVSVDGQEGADQLTSAGADDALGGGQGNDRLDARGGNDSLNGGEGDDTLVAGDGNDRVDAGVGGDAVDAGTGDDTVVAADGYADTIDCGPGADSVQADGFDQVVNCETASRQDVAPPPSGGGAAGGASGGRVEDSARPIVQVGGSTLQRVSLRRRRLAIAVSASERSLVNISGYLAARGLNDQLRPRTARIDVGGGGAEVRLTLTGKQLRRVLADLRRGRRPRVILTVSAVDAAGNTSRPRRLTVTLRR